LPDWVLAEREESIYERVSRLEDEVATMRNEMDIIKVTTRNKIVRYEHRLIREGIDAKSIVG